MFWTVFACKWCMTFAYFPPDSDEMTFSLKISILWIEDFLAGSCHGPAGVPRLATRCLCVLSTWLVVCWCHVLPCDCLSPPILLLNHCFSGSSCVSLVTLVCLPIQSPCVCSPVLIRCLTSCECLMFDCAPVFCLPACLLVFPPRGGFCCSFVSLYYIKTWFPLHLSPRPHLSPDRSNSLKLRMS